MVFPLSRETYYNSETPSLEPQVEETIKEKRKQAPALPELSASVTGAVGGMWIFLQVLAGCGW